MSGIVTKSSQFRLQGCLVLSNLTDLIRRLTTSTTPPSIEKDVLMMSHTCYEDTRPLNNASPLIVLHGLFAERMQWKTTCEQILNKLTPTRKIIAVDLRNHGESPHIGGHGYPEMAQDIYNFSKSQAIQSPFCLMGHGMGGMAAMYYALKYPATICKLIIVDIAPIKYYNSKMLDYLLAAMEEVKVPNNVEVDVGMSLANDQLAKKIRSASLRGFILSNLVKTTDGRVNLPAIKDHVRDIVSFPDVKGVYKSPALFISGKQSPYFRVPDDVISVNKYFPMSTIETVENSGHDVHISQPEKFVKLCTRYLNDVMSCV